MTGPSKKIAYASPLPPQKTGIAQYSEQLLMAFRQYLPEHQINVVDELLSQPETLNNDNVAGYPVIPISPLLFSHKARQKFDHFIYHIGNNPQFHQHILMLLKIQPGIVVLHDTVLYFLVAGGGAGALWRALLADGYDGESAKDIVSQIKKNSPGKDLCRFRQPEKYPLLTAVTQHAEQIVVHSQMAARTLKNEGFRKPIHIMPMLAYESSLSASSASKSFHHAELAALHNQCQQDQKVVFGLFGFGGETKRAKQVFEAIKLLPEDLQQRLMVIVIGTDLYHGDAVMAGLTNIVKSFGYVNNADFDNAMAWCDAIINLRYPSMGETSAVQIQAMATGKATFVSDNAWFAELPNETVIKITVGESEVKTLGQQFRLLLQEPKMLKEVGHKAKRYVESHHNAAKITNIWRQILTG